MLRAYSNWHLDPRARVVGTAFAMAGAFLTDSPQALGLGLTIGVLPLVLLTGIQKAYFRFIVVLVLPIAIALLIVWGWLVGAPPGMPIGSAPTLGATYAATVVLRLAMLGGLGQLCLITVAPHDLAQTLRAIGLKDDALVIALASFALVPEIRLRLEQVTTAQYARGLLLNRRMTTRLRQFPHTLRPLFAWVLRSALQRSDAWRQRGLQADRLGSPLLVSRPASVAILVLSFVWMGVGVVTRFF